MIAKLYSTSRSTRIEFARTLPPPHSHPAQYVHRLLPRLVAGRLRFFYPDLLRQRHRHHFSRASFRHRRGHFPHASHASHWRISLRLHRRSLRTPSRADDRHHRVLNLRTGHGLRPLAPRFPHHARLFRHSHGRRMGSRRGPGIRNSAKRKSRLFLGITAGRLRGRLSAGRAWCTRAYSRSSAGAECS